MPLLKDLIPDIKQILSEKVILDPTDLAQFGTKVALHLEDTFKEARARTRDPNVLYPSDIGKPCTRQIWYKYHTPELATPLAPTTELKFFLGDFGEELLLYLAKLAGHKVEHEQFGVDYEIGGGVRIRGRIDAVIDGHIVDVKTTSPYSFSAFQKGLDDKTDMFGYRYQVNSYLHAPELSDYSDKQPFLFLFDKQNANMGLAWVPVISIFEMEERAKSISEALKRDVPPPRQFKSEDRKSVPGKYLNTACQYCDFNMECWSAYSIRRVLRKGKVTYVVAERLGESPMLLPGDLDISTAVEVTDDE